MQHLLAIHARTVTISDDERAFFVAFGERLARLRKAQSISQVQLAATLGVSQQAVTAYENGQRRVPLSMLSDLADALGTSIEELIGTTSQAKRTTGKRGPQPKIAQQLERIQSLPAAKQKAIAQVLDSVIAAHQ